ncbi:MAG: MBL fold metallo-hydrolase [Nitrospinae bacterium]|nr:MBL fold metallo-hydrolase [Nitrospinota bacterium]
MINKRIVVGVYEVNCYIVGCKGHNKAVIIDPGDEGDKILKYIEKEDIDVRYIISTHAHADHIGAIADIKARTGASFLLHEDDVVILNAIQTRDMITYLGLKPSPQPDRLIKGDEIIELCDDLFFKVLHTPGHTPGGISLLVNNYVYTGDALFAGSIGRTDFPMGSYPDIIDSIKTKLMTLDDNVRVLPGHGPDTTIGYERKNNLYLTQS